MEETIIPNSRKATLRYARISARKVKIVADLIRGKEILMKALAIAKYAPKSIKRNYRKIIKISYRKC